MKTSFVGSILICVAIGLSACGGGGSSSPSSEPIADEPNDTPVVGDEDPTPDPIPTPDPDSRATTTDGSFYMDAVWALGQPFSADPTVELSVLTGVAVNSAGNIALAGSVTPTATRSSESAVIGGTPNSLNYVIREGDSFANQPPGIRFGNASGLRITNEGAVGFLANIDGAVDGQAYALQTDEGVELVAFTDGTTVTGLDGVEYTVRTITGGYPTDSTVAIHSRGAELRSNLLWISENGVSKAILQYGGGDTPRPITDDGCGIAIPFSISMPFFVRDNGDVYFLAERERANDCDSFYSIVRYSNDVYETVVTGGQTAPGFPDETLAGIRILDFDNGEGIFFYADLRQGDTFQTRNEIGSLWFYNFDGAFELLAVEGQTFDYPIGSGEVDGLDRFTLQVDVSEKSKQWVTGLSAGASGFAVLGGDVAQDEGLTDPRNPSPLMLNQLMTAADEVFGFDDGQTHNGFSNLEAVGDNQYLISTIVGNAGSTRGISTKWLATGETPTELYRSGDSFIVAGDEYFIEDTFGNALSGSVVGTSQTRDTTTVTSNGVIFSTAQLRASGVGRFGNGLLMLTPRNP